jgi:CBS domain-containing protein
MGTGATANTGSFGLTMRGLEAGLRVQHIAAFDLMTCSLTDSVSKVLADKALSDFDQIPVHDELGRVVGVLKRTDRRTDGTVASAMQHLDESLLLSAEAPILSFIQIAGTVPYKLVLNQEGIKGIVTRSDLLKLPVRLFAFAGITHLETLMFEVIRTKFKFGDDSWSELLKVGRREKIRWKEKRLKKSRMDLDLLELTDFCDKRELVKIILSLGDDFVEQMQNAEELRNQIAHAATFITSDATAREFAVKLQQVEAWIERLESKTKQRVKRDGEKVA